MHNHGEMMHTQTEVTPIKAGVEGEVGAFQQRLGAAPQGHL